MVDATDLKLNLLDILIELSLSLAIKEVKTLKIRKRVRTKKWNGLG